MATSEKMQRKNLPFKDVEIDSFLRDNIFDDSVSETEEDGTIPVTMKLRFVDNEHSGWEIYPQFTRKLSEDEKERYATAGKNYIEQHSDDVVIKKHLCAWSDPRSSLYAPEKVYLYLMFQQACYDAAEDQNSPPIIKKYVQQLESGKILSSEQLEKSLIFKNEQEFFKTSLQASVSSLKIQMKKDFDAAKKYQQSSASHVQIKPRKKTFNINFKHASLDLKNLTFQFNNGIKIEFSRNKKSLIKGSVPFSIIPKPRNKVVR